MKAVVLLSGGIDSTTCLAMAVDKYGKDEVTALSLYYGQKHQKEIKAAKDIAKYYGVEHNSMNIEDAFIFSSCPLLQGEGDIIHKSYAEQLKDLGGEGTVDTYVPFRNGLFLSYAAAIAISKGAEVVYYGAHADDGAGRAYPDCTPEFVLSMSRAIYEGSGKKCSLMAPLLLMNKSDVVAEGLRLKAPYQLTWSCYEGDDYACGECGTCIDRQAAFEKNGINDPIPYEVKGCRGT